MTIDSVFKQIQDIVSAPTPPVIVLGSGASISYGIASMSSLATMLKDYFSSKSYVSESSKECVNRFLSLLEGGERLGRCIVGSKGY